MLGGWGCSGLNLTLIQSSPADLIYEHIIGAPHGMTAAESKLCPGPSLRAISIAVER